jgi:hypothetical protein
VFVEGQCVIVQRTTNRPPLMLMAAALAACLLLGSLGPGAAPAAAQATPAPGAAQVEPILCEIEPTTGERFAAALDAAAAAPASPGPLERFTLDALPAGEPAGQTEIDALTATVEMALACRNAGDFPRVYALFSDRMIGQLYGGRATVPPETIEVLQVAPRRIRPQFWVNLVELSNASRLPDGRVGAVVVTANATHTFTDYLYFVDVDGQWLIDQAVAISSSPVANGPAASPAP